MNIEHTFSETLNLRQRINTFILFITLNMMEKRGLLEREVVPMGMKCCIEGSI